MCRGDTVTISPLARRYGKPFVFRIRSRVVRGNIAGAEVVCICLFICLLVCVCACVCAQPRHVHPQKSRPCQVRSAGTCLCDRDMCLRSAESLSAQGLRHCLPHAPQEMYEIHKEAAILHYVLFVNCYGSFALNIVDNLVILHHQESKVCV